MNKEELIFVKLSENIGSGFHKMINGWDSHYHLKPLIEGDFDFYKITFPTTTTQKTTQKKSYDREKEILEIIEKKSLLKHGRNCGSYRIVQSWSKVSYR